MVRQDEEGLHVPKWLMSVFAALLVAVITNGITTWAKANYNSETVTRHEHRIENIEKKYAEIANQLATLQQNVADMKETQNANTGKVDRILELEMSRH